MILKKFKRLFKLLSATVILIWIFYNIVMIRHYKRMNQYLSLVLRSDCDCRLNEKIFFSQSSDPFVLDVRSSRHDKILYNVSVDTIESAQFTCGLYHTFRRGQQLKVIGYSLTNRCIIKFYQTLPGQLSKCIRAGLCGSIMTTLSVRK